MSYVHIAVHDINFQNMISRNSLVRTLRVRILSLKDFGGNKEDFANNMSYIAKVEKKVGKSEEKTNNMLTLDLLRTDFTQPQLYFLYHLHIFRKNCSFVYTTLLFTPIYIFSVIFTYLSQLNQKPLIASRFL